MSRIAVLLRYFHTLRHLKLIQFTARLQLKLTRPVPNLAPAPTRRAVTGRWTPVAGRPPSMTGPQRFRFLNEERSISQSQDETAEKLWLYNLHYFDDLNAQGAHERRAWHADLIEHWMDENPPARTIGWDPYPASLRLVNWIKYALDGNELSGRALDHLAISARWIKQRTEWHLLGNHLFANAKALIFAGSFFSGQEAQGWLRAGQAILGRELDEQILTDGGHFERSTLYHALAVEDVLDLINLSRTFGEVEPNLPLDDNVDAMLLWLLGMSHPDGQIGLFNDAAIGIAPGNDELLSYAARLGFSQAELGAGLMIMSESGYRRVEHGPVLALIDVAPLGPDYLPAHGHADTLSFELSLAGQRLVVNSGTSRYGAGSERLRQRGTAAHNCVVVDGLNSSDVWGGFRVGRRARPFDVTQRQDPSCIEIGCSHDGYRHLAGQPIHRRTWRFEREHLTVTDRINGRCRSAEAYVHLHPSVTVTRRAEGFSLQGAEGIALYVDFVGGTAQLAESTYHPEFGLEIPNTVIVVAIEGQTLTTTFSWSL